jgi:membrane protease YdiL (CAAX protease family)
MANELGGISLSSDRFSSALVNCCLFFLVYFGSYAAAALLVRPVYAILGNCGGQLSAYVLSRPFGKIYGRIHWACLLLGFIFLMLRCKLTSTGKIGIHWKKWHQCLRFFLGGAAVTAIPLSAAMVGGGWQLRDNIAAYALPMALSGAVLAAVAEEIIFRGLLLRILCGAVGPRISLAFSSLFFAFAHFSKGISSKFSGALPTLSDGFRAAADSLSTVMETFQPMQFLSLLLLGLFLGALFLNCGNLMASIGFHGGAAFVLIFFRRAVVTASMGSSAAWLLDSPLCPTVLCLLLSFHIHGNESPKKFRRPRP